MNKLLMLAFLIMSCCGHKEVKITRLTIMYVDFDMETFYSIKCETFENKFKSAVQRKTITNNSTLTIFNRYLSKLKPDKEKYIPDVRTKIIVYK